MTGKPEIIKLLPVDRLYREVKLSALADSSAELRAHASLVHIQVVCCKHVPRIVVLHLLQHLFFTSGLEAARSLGLVAAGVAAMGKYEQAGFGTGGDVA